MDFDPIKKQMICMLCLKRFDSMKLDTIKKHHKSRHNSLNPTQFTSSRKRLLIMKYESEQRQQQGQIQQLLDPQKKVALATYKLAFIVGKHKKPLSDCEHYVEFAKAADPDSEVFKQMASSRTTITRRIVEIHAFLKKELRDEICRALFWSYILDESTDKSVAEEVILYARFVNITSKKIVTRFLAVSPVQGHPNATNIFSAIESVVGSGGFDLPLSQVVSQTSDGASTMLSTCRGVAAKAIAAFNSKLFIQHCFNHRLVLAGKDGQHHIPNEVEDTIKDILNHFKYSAVSQSQLKSIIQLKEEKYIKLVSYHKVRWLSLNECIQRLVSLHSVLCEYFEEQAHDMTNRKIVRTKCENLLARLQDPEFMLYLFFLHSYLPLLSQINVYCQRKNGLIFESYSKIQTIITTLIEPLVLDSTLAFDELFADSNLKVVDPDTYGYEGELRFMGKEFNDYWKEIQDNGDLSILQQKTVLMSCQAYILEIARSLHVRFPERSFIVSTCNFLSPPRRKHQIVNIQALIERFDNHYFDHDAIERGYHSYRNDDLLDFLYEDKYSANTNGDSDNIVGFWCELYCNFPEYKELSKLAILIMTITPDTCECERGFSTMNFVKNELRTAMTTETLNACMAVGLEERSMDDFPFFCLL